MTFTIKKKELKKARDELDERKKAWDAYKINKTAPNREAKWLLEDIRLSERNVEKKEAEMMEAFSKKINKKHNG